MTVTTSAAGRHAQRRTVGRKNLLLDLRNIDQARRIFNSNTDTDAIHQALASIDDDSTCPRARRSGTTCSSLRVRESWAPCY